MQILIDIEVKQSVIMEGKQRKIEPNTIGQFPLDAGITVCQTDLAMLRVRKAWTNNNILEIGIKWIMSYMPAISFVDSVQFENLASLRLTARGGYLSNFILKWLTQKPDLRNSD